MCCAAIRAPIAALGLAKLAPSISGAQSGWRAFVARKSGRLLLALQPGEKRHNVVGVAARSAANRRRLRLWYGRQGDSPSGPFSSADGDYVARLYPANRAVEPNRVSWRKVPTLQATSRSDFCRESRRRYSVMGRGAVYWEKGGETLLRWLLNRRVGSI